MKWRRALSINVTSVPRTGARPRSLGLGLGLGSTLTTCTFTLTFTFTSSRPQLKPLHYRPFHTRHGLQSAAGAEPGLSPYAGYTSPQAQHCQIKIIDYSKTRLEENNVNSLDLDAFLRDQPKPGWAAARWIWVNGISLDVIQCLGRSKGLHPLAIEDVMDTHATTKVDWYDNHCFVEMNLVQLAHEGSNTIRRGSHARNEVKERKRSRRTLVPGRFGMSVEQVSAFLTSDNTIITIFEHSGEDVLAPIMLRLRSPQTVVRSSGDPSMLLQAVIDAVVDLSLPIGIAASEAFDDLEQDVLENPTIGQSKQLHILRSGLTQLMENANAIAILVRTLCDHGSIPSSRRRLEEGSPDSTLVQQTNTSVVISPTTQIYLRDVQDHVTALSNNTRTSIRSAENLSSLIFNTIAASQNESVRSLTLVSSFFLPLTFLTGYFGMNFEPMWATNNHSDAFFWLIATPVMLTTMTILMRARSKVNRRQQWIRQGQQPNVATRRLRS